MKVLGKNLFSALQLLKPSFRDFVLLAGGKRKAWLSVSSLARQLLAFYFILCRTSVTREADALTLGYWKKSR